MFFVFIIGSTGEDVKIGGNGVAYKTPNRIPKQDKRGEKSNKPTFDKNGVANPPKERIPQGVKSKRGSDNDDDVLEDLTKSVDKLIEKLAQKGHKFNEKYYVRKNDKKSTEKKVSFSLTKALDHWIYTLHAKKYNMKRFY